MAIHTNSLSSMGKYGSFTPEDLGLVRGEDIAGPPNSYAERQKLQTLRLRDDVGSRAVEWSMLTEKEQYKKLCEEGACLGANTGLFYPGKEATEIDALKEKAAKAICNGCELQVQCLEYALSTHQKNGVWGGASEKDRRRIIKSRQTTARRAKNRSAA